MPTWLAIALGVFVLLVIVLAAGGAYARKRQLAAAHANDRGWAPDGLEAAARSAYAEQRSGAQPRELTLVQIVDLPGTDEDKAVFEVKGSDRAERLTLGRQDGEWVFEQLA